MGIDINLKVGYDEATAQISTSGNIVQTANSDDLKKAGVTPNNIKKYIMEKYKMPSVNPLIVQNNALAHIDVQDSKILQITSEPIIVKTQKFINNSSSTGVFNVSIKDTVTNTMSNSWSTGGTLTVSQKITYGLGFIGSGETQISYSQSWGIGGSSSTQYTVGSDSGVSVTIEPGKGVLAQLSASRGVLKAQVDYNAYFSGTFKVIDPFLIPIEREIDIKDFLEFNNLNNSIKSSETLEAGYYSSSEIILSDLDGNAFATRKY